ncbi:DNA methyltransferase [Okeania sp.]|uniref:DNA methyltransferase n=1 Tax=Okeania sp. TaxID=3100323 RepID=UPI002B4ADF43|nr:DNA methyltransferase [Okeania sp.]MEB3340241.1 DNA methyltransferase [Okeania sp.]
MAEFDRPISQKILDITNKKRSNLFTWRGQFSPELIETILKVYCLPNSVVLDPFAGSGTVLLEAGSFSLEAYGCDINPVAWIFGKIYELINQPQKKELLSQVRKILDKEFPIRILFDHEKEVECLPEKVSNVRDKLDKNAKEIFDILIILVDGEKSNITNELIQSKFYELVKLIQNLPNSSKTIKAYLSDARLLPISDNKIDFVVTSPPYINVFNYHQNYRKAAEMLGWDLLKIAKSEIGSNRANRGNRFYTVVQYCLDIAETLKELSRVCKKDARLVFVVGYESNVLGVPFYNADIIERIAIESGLYRKVLRQKRSFKNKFGKIIREDLINFYNLKPELTIEFIDNVAREVAIDALKNAISVVSSQNYKLLENSIGKVPYLERTPKLNLQQIPTIKSL